MPSKNYIREWRKHRRLSLRSLEKLTVNEDGEPIASYVHIGRIERGISPYTQPILESLAQALGVSPIILLSCRPGEERLMKAVETLSQRERERVADVIEAMTRR